MDKKLNSFPPQHQENQPGVEHRMKPRPDSEMSGYRGSAKLKGRKALITGGDSGIGRAVGIAFAKEGADIFISYLNEEADAAETLELIRAEGVKAESLAGDIGDETFCEELVKEAAGFLGGIDILVNNAAEQHPEESLDEITSEQMIRTFKTNFFSVFYLCRLVVPKLKRGGTIINSTSVTAYRGSKHLIDYASTKGAIVSFTRSLSTAIAERGVRVNCVAPGPVWTPLIPASFDAEHVKHFGAKVPMGRAAQPSEIAPSYVFLACEDSSYYTGQVLHPNGGEIVNA